MEKCIKIRGFTVNDSQSPIFQSLGPLAEVEVAMALAASSFFILLDMALGLKEEILVIWMRCVLAWMAVGAETARQRRRMPGGDSLSPAPKFK